MIKPSPPSRLKAHASLRGTGERDSFETFPQLSCSVNATSEA